MKTKLKIKNYLSEEEVENILIEKEKEIMNKIICSSQSSMSCATNDLQTGQPISDCSCCGGGPLSGG